MGEGHGNGVSVVRTGLAGNTCGSVAAAAGAERDQGVAEVSRAWISDAARAARITPSARGWLEKRYPIAPGGWQRRYCVLRSCVFTYYADESCREKKGSINISARTRLFRFEANEAPGESTKHWSERPFGFVVDTDAFAEDMRPGRLFYFDAGDLETLAAWEKAFSRELDLGQSCCQNGSVEDSIRHCCSIDSATLREDGGLEDIPDEEIQVAILEQKEQELRDKMGEAWRAEAQNCEAFGLLGSPKSPGPGEAKDPQPNFGTDVGLIALSAPASKEEAAKEDEPKQHYLEVSAAPPQNEKPAQSDEPGTPPTKSSNAADPSLQPLSSVLNDGSGEATASALLVSSPAPSATSSSPRPELGSAAERKQRRSSVRRERRVTATFLPLAIPGSSPAAGSEDAANTNDDDDDGEPV
mmetsp:Transcript_23746/g.63562  ORF Transcript_23746/g.63562 Transcript_23746/m.63562 type:complete len:413 (-) Transcript_23746:30-1268(-)